MCRCNKILIVYEHLQCVQYCRLCRKVRVLFALEANWTDRRQYTPDVHGILNGHTQRVCYSTTMMTHDRRPTTCGRSIKQHELSWCNKSSHNLIFFHIYNLYTVHWGQFLITFTVSLVFVLALKGSAARFRHLVYYLLDLFQSAVHQSLVVNTHIYNWAVLLASWKRTGAINILCASPWCCCRFCFFF